MLLLLACGSQVPAKQASLEQIPKDFASLALYAGQWLGPISDVAALPL